MSQLVKMERSFYTTVGALLATALVSDQAPVTTTTVKLRLNCHLIVTRKRALK